MFRTPSYVLAVKKAVSDQEVYDRVYAKTGMEPMYHPVNDWRRFMTTQPIISNHREV